VYVHVSGWYAPLTSIPPIMRLSPPCGPNAIAWSVRLFGVTFGVYCTARNQVFEAESYSQRSPYNSRTCAPPNRTVFCVVRSYVRVCPSVGGGTGDGGARFVHWFVGAS